MRSNRDLEEFGIHRREWCYDAANCDGDWFLRRGDGSGSVSAIIDFKRPQAGYNPNNANFKAQGDFGHPLIRPVALVTYHPFPSGDWLYEMVGMNAATRERVPHGLRVMREDAMITFQHEIRNETRKAKPVKQDMGFGRDDLSPMIRRWGLLPSPLGIYLEYNHFKTIWIIRYLRVGTPARQRWEHERDMEMLVDLGRAMQRPAIWCRYSKDRTHFDLAGENEYAKPWMPTTPNKPARMTEWELVQTLYDINKERIPGEVRQRILSDLPVEGRTGTEGDGFAVCGFRSKDPGGRPVRCFRERGHEQYDPEHEYEWIAA